MDIKTSLWKTLIIGLALNFANPTFAMTLREVDYTCPIGGEKFSQTMPMSGTSFGMRTDFMKLGAISSPWKLPQCPTNHFVMFQKEFTADEITKYQKIIASPEFLAIPNNAPQYYYLAKQFELAGADDFETGFTYLQASWQGGMVEQSRQKALGYFLKALPTLDKKSEKWKTANLLIGELYRLQGHFEKAKNQFETLRSQSFTQDEKYKGYIDFELNLIAQRNALPQIIPRK